MVPTLSKLPPSITHNKERHQKCILLLFKPFTCFQELYSSINWDETYSEFLETTDHMQYIENIEELQTEKEKGNDENDDEIADDEGNEDCIDNEADDTDSDVDEQTIEALEIIKRTSWLNESRSHHPTGQNMQPIIEHTSRSTVWTNETQRQNDDLLNNDESDESEIQQEPVLNPAQPMEINDNNITIEQHDTQTDNDDIQEIVDDTICKYSLNKKQRVAFEMSIANVI